MQNLRFSVLGKIWAGIVLLIMGYAVSMGSFYHASQSIWQQINASVEIRYPLARTSQELITRFAEQNKLCHDAVLLGDTEKVEQAMNLCASINQTLDQIASKSPVGQQENLARIKNLFDGYVAEASEVYPLMASGESNDTLIKRTLSLAEVKKQLETLIAELDQEISKDLLGNLQSVAAFLSRKLTQNLILFVIVLLVCSVSINFLLQKLVIKPLFQLTQAAREMKSGNNSVEISYQSHDEIGELAEAFRQMASSQVEKARIAEQIAEGDLTGDFKPASEKDRLGSALALMSRHLRSMINKILKLGEVLTTQSQQVSQANQILSEGAVESAASLEEISASIIAIENKTSANAGNAWKSKEIAVATGETIKKGGALMNRLSDSIARISKSSDQIAKVIKLIDDIAFQTNLLALNAAVEAARAGSSGRGFAVVADEVRNLAQRSAKAAKETSDLINESIQNVQDGKELAEQTESAFVAVRENSEKLQTLVQEIALDTQEQATSMHQVKDGLHQIEAVIQQNAARAEETTAATEEMVLSTQSLQSTMDFFKTS